MPWVNGQILTEEGFQEGGLEFDENEIVDISRQKSRDPLATGLVLPLLVNPHTHIGDSFIKNGLEGTIEEIVAPPDGLKHRLLAQASDEEVIAGMREAIELMTRSGVSHFVDFREGGLKGASLLYRALLDYPISSIVYGRPDNLEYDKREMRGLLRIVDGIGVSSILDWEESTLMKIMRDARSFGKGFAFHASERVREDIDSILDFEPDFVVHMVEASDSDLERCADSDVPVVVCPRSNAHYGKAPRLRKMLEVGIHVMLGTDNSMLNSTSIFDEMRFVSQMFRNRDGLTSSSILRMALNSRKVLKGQSGLSLKIGEPSELLVLEWSNGNPENFIVEKASEKDISVISRGRRLWTQKEGNLKEESDWPKKE